MPAIGARLMCTSNTLMKIDTRVTGSRASEGVPLPSSIVSSAGGSTCAISETRPSAGETMKASSCGTTRSGSRKKANTPSERNAIGQAIVSHAMNAAARLMPTAISPNLRPSGWIGGQCQPTSPRPLLSTSSPAMPAI